MRRASIDTCWRRPASTAGSPGGGRGDVAGTLYVVAAPPRDPCALSPRAAATLKRVAVVAAEDTRHSKPLLVHAGSRAELISFHEHSSDRALERILRILTDARDVALFIDPGHPA